MTGWACVQTYGSAEKKAVQNLERQGFTAFCPFFIRPLPTLMSPKAAREAPLFPCYIFVLLVDGQPWGKVNSTYGCIRILTDRNRDNPTPLWLPDEFIEEKVKAITSRAEDNRLPPNTLVKVRQKDSPFFDLVGVVTEMDKNQRVFVLMSLFKRDVVVEFESVSYLQVLELPNTNTTLSML